MPSKRGFVTVEFALIAPMLLLFLAAVLDYTMLMRAAVAVADAARAGAQYGSLSPSNVSDTTGMQNAALNAAPDVTGLTAIASKSCQCSDGSTVNCTGGTCSSGPVRVYVKVTAKATVNSIFSYSQLPYTGVVSCSTSMRAQ